MKIKELTDKVITATRNNQYNREVVEIHVKQGIYILLDSGVDEKVATSEKAIGFLCSYLTDVDNQNSGEIKLSSFTKSRLAQLTMVSDHSAIEEADEDVQD